MVSSSTDEVMLQFREDVNRLLAIVNSERELDETQRSELLSQAECLGERFLKIEKYAYLGLLLSVHVQLSSPDCILNWCIYGIATFNLRKDRLGTCRGLLTRPYWALLCCTFVHLTPLVSIAHGGCAGM